MHDESEDVVALRRRLAETEQQLGELQQRLTSRRHLLRLSGAAAVGAATAVVAGTGAAEAASGAMQYGSANNAGADQTELSATNTVFTLRVNNTSQFASTVMAINSSAGTGIEARADTAGASARGVDASVNGANGYAIAAAGGRAQIYMSQGFDAGPAVSQTHSIGELAVTGNALWFCVTAGNPGTWRKVAAVETAGSFHPLPTARVYDSRWTNILPNVTKGSMVVGNSSRLVYCDDQRALDTGLVTQADVVPAGATAIAYNLTLTQASGQGFLAVEPGGTPAYGGSAVNWTPNVTSVANASVAKLDSQRRISVFIGGQPGALTHFIVDVVGYYR